MAREAREYRLGSSPLVHAPGLVRWAKHGYDTSRGRQRAVFVKMVSDGWHIPKEDAKGLLSGKYRSWVEGEVLIFRNVTGKEKKEAPKGKGRTLFCNPMSKAQATKLIRDYGMRWLRMLKKGKRKDLWQGRAEGLGMAIMETGRSKKVRRAGQRLTNRAFAMGSRLFGKNPIDIGTAWQGSKAKYISPKGDYGVVPHSELAMHTRIAGKKVVKYALFTRKPNGRREFVNWAQVMTPDGTITDGLPSEVLPESVRQKLGYGREILSAKTRKALPNKGPVKGVIHAVKRDHGKVILFVKGRYGTKCLGMSEAGYARFKEDCKRVVGCRVKVTRYKGRARLLKC